MANKDWIAELFRNLTNTRKATKSGLTFEEVMNGTKPKIVSTENNNSNPFDVGLGFKNIDADEQALLTSLVHNKKPKAIDIIAKTAVDPYVRPKGVADIGKITPDVYAAGSDKLYADMGVNGGVDNVLVNASKTVDVPSKVSPEVAKLASIVQTSNKPKSVVAVKREPVISSDPGYVDGYKVDRVDAGSSRAGKAIHDALMGLNAGAYGADDGYGIDY